MEKGGKLSFNSTVEVVERETEAETEKESYRDKENVEERMFTKTESMSNEVE